MRWFSGLHPKYYPDKHEDLIRDFIESGADILYQHLVLQPEPYAKYPELKRKILVIFLENPTNDRSLFDILVTGLRTTKNYWGYVIATGTTDRRIAEIATSSLNPSQWFPIWPCLPYTYFLYQKAVEPTFGEFLMAWVPDEIKGKREIEALSVFLPIKIHDYSSKGPTMWSKEMHFSSCGLVWASRLDSISRAFVSAAVSRKPAVLLRTTAELFENYESVAGQEFYDSVTVKDNLRDWFLATDRIVHDRDYAIEQGLKLHNFFKKYEKFWDWNILYEKFYDQFGIKFPKDLTPLHHLPPNYFSADYFDRTDIFPQGAWSTEPPSVNWETGLGL